MWFGLRLSGVMAAAGVCLAGIVLTQCLVSCSPGQPGPVTEMTPAQQVSGFPPPSQLMKTGQYVDSDRLIQGGSYSDVGYGFDDLVEADGDDAVFSPTWNDNETHSILNAARAGFFFYQLQDFDGSPEVDLEWTTAPDQADLWVGLANWSKDRWDWYQPAGSILSLSSLDPYIGASGVYAVVIVLGAEQAQLDWIRIGPQLWQIDVVDNSCEVEYTSLGLDSEDNPYIAYYDVIHSALKFAFHDGTDWNTEIVDSGGVGKYASLELDSDDMPHIAYYDSVNEKVKYASFDGAVWHFETIGGANLVGRGCSLALDSLDRPHIVYMNTSNVTIDYARFDGTTWQYESLIPGLFEFNIGFMLDHADRPLLTFPFPTPPAAQDQMFVNYDGSSWHYESVVPGNQRTGSSEQSLALGSDGVPHVLLYDYEDPDSGYPYYVSRISGNWTAERVPTEMSTGTNASLVLNSVDEPLFACYGSGLELWSKTGGTWHGTVVDHNGYVGLHTSLKLDSNEHPCISYTASDPKELRFARYVP